MKILVLNGSPRKGNTLTAINALCEGAAVRNQVEIIDAYKVNVGQCVACDACECKNGCVAEDDTNSVIDKIVDADMIVVASPVYSWGITARVKIIIEKCYCRDQQVKGKKLGVIIVGADVIDNDQYRIIREQFGCMAEYMKWETVFYKSYSASGVSDLAADNEAVSELKSIGLSL